MRLSRYFLNIVFCAGILSFAAEEPKEKSAAKPAETAGSETKPADHSEVPAGPLQRLPYKDDINGYSVMLPPGYAKLTENETHEIFKGLSQFISKEASERAQKRPPAWFKGPIDPKHPELPPPMFAVGFSDLKEPIHPDQLNAYKDMLEEEYKRQGNKFGEIGIQTTVVDGITALQVEHDVFSPINNERSRELLVTVPAKGKTYNLDFNFSSEQTESVHAALKDVLDSFKINDHPEADAPNQIKWQRVAAYTIGFGLAGVLLSLILKKLGGSGSAEQDAG